MAVSVLSSSGAKIALAQYLLTKYPPAVPQVWSQSFSILKALLAGQRLTSPKAANELHVLGLPQKIEYLRRLGWDIKTVRKYAKNDFGQLTRQAEYFITGPHA